MINYDNHYIEYISVGEFYSDRNWIHPERIIDSYEIILVLKGTVHIQEEDKKYTLNKNNIIILEPGKPHKGFVLSRPPTAFYWLHFRTDMPMPFKIYCGNNFIETKLLIKKILHISNTPAYPKISADACALMIFNELEALGRNTDSANHLSHKIAEYIRININENISVSTVAEHFGYHPDYMGKIFKNSFNTGIKNYISKQKISAAKNMLISTDLSIKQVANALGYSEENLFLKFFKYHEEISPAEFRNLYRATHMNNK